MILGITLLFIPLLLSSCAERDEPDPAVVQKLLGSFFEGQGFRIVSLDLGGIEGEPIAQKTYGRKRAFYSTVKRIVLEGKGKQVTRENGVVMIRQKAGGSKDWDIEGIPAELAP
ncbi:MAG: hypothetical protein C0402_10925 [Thermodesulfovibrio sp.]|nr:hypothetical protein [Thermodesulfovibrio sp.]